ncbi:hypothetical protein ACI3PL_28890, partial [Lacticaseibacillus paracasei]
ECVIDVTGAADRKWMLAVLRFSDVTEESINENTLNVAFRPLITNTSGTTTTQISASHANAKRYHLHCASGSGSVSTFVYNE